MFDSAIVFLFPVGVAISIIAMSSGISGANFWVPVYLLYFDLDPRVSFWLALLTMIFGFGSGIVRHLKQKTIKPRLAFTYSAIAVVGAVIGSKLSPYVETSLLILAFGGFVFFYGLYITSGRLSTKQKTDRISWKIALIGGLLKGLVSTGLGELLMPQILRHRNCTHAEAVGTTICVVFLTNLVAVTAIATNDQVFQEIRANWDQIRNIMLVVAPSVIIGGQIGPRIPHRMSEENFKRYVGVLLVLVGLSSTLKMLIFFHEP